MNLIILQELIHVNNAELEKFLIEATCTGLVYPCTHYPYLNDLLTLRATSFISLPWLLVKNVHCILSYDFP